ncbi:MAG: hypothetical protein KDF65_01420, partial [Anaerolineae bacterium]|nr:hypothetical protein [Anaerolineae bacterium]
MNYDLLRKIRSLLISWLIILTFVTVGCQRIQFENVNPPLPFLTFDQNEGISFVNLPLAVQEFRKHPHLPPESQAPLLTVTWFPRPYPKFFDVLLLWEDGSISNYREVPDWAVQGGTGAELTMNELQEMRNLLDKLTGVQTPTTGNGTTVIAFRF